MYNSVNITARSGYAIGRFGAARSPGSLFLSNHIISTDTMSDRILVPVLITGMILTVRIVHHII